jgi:DNA-binding NtrC family response regulator
MTIRVLIIEDEALIRWSLRQKFEACGYEVTEAENGAAALNALEGSVFDLVMLDYKLPDMTGFDILRAVREADRDVVVIMMTAHSSIEGAVDAMRLGAFDYIPKPFQMDHVLGVVSKALETTKLRREVRELRRQVSNDYGLEQIIGQDPCMLEMFDTIRNIAKSSATTVFLRGETGTGKDLVARVIHYNSERATRPFMNITCTALSETLLESELFGHEKGAFTDAKMTKKGLFELSDGGTIFLDEVGDMPPGLQAKLLRFLEERTFRRVGGTRETSVDVRVIAATNRDVEKAVGGGQFREDLLYRLNVIPIYLPALRERPGDIRLLAQHFATRFSKEFKKPISGIDEAAYAKLGAYAWPGNVRELRNVIERAVLLGKGPVIQPSDLVLGRPTATPAEPSAGPFTLPAGGIDLHQVEQSLIEQAMARTQNNQTHAAKLLNLKRDALRNRLAKYGLLKGDEE